MKSSRFRMAFQLLCWEGVFAMAYDTWVGPTYLTGLAGELGAKLSTVSLLASLPWVGLTGQLIGLLVFRNIPSVKDFAVRFAAASRLIWALPMILAIFFGMRAAHTGTPFPKGQWLRLVAVVACISALCGSLSAVTWQSWMKGIVPSRFRARFFGHRQRFVMIAILSANGLAALWVSWKPGGYFAGYFILGTLALILANVSLWLLGRVPDVCAVADAPAQLPAPVESILAPLKNKEFRSFLIYAAAFNGAVQLAGSYFPFYFTSVLKIPMSSVAIWSMLGNLGAILTASFWGVKLDRAKDPKALLYGVGALISVAPMFYLFPSAAFISRMAPLEYFTNGMYWCGYGIAITQMLFRVCPEGRNTAYFSLYAAGTGLTGAICAFLGGHLAQWMEPVGGFRALFLVSGLARLAVIGVATRMWMLSRKPALAKVPTAAIELEPA